MLRTWGPVRELELNEFIIGVESRRHWQHDAPDVARAPEAFRIVDGGHWSCPRQTGQVASWCALMKSRGERIPRARCGCISL